jgi:aldose 1-epimerase
MVSHSTLDPARIVRQPLHMAKGGWPVESLILSNAHGMKVGFMAVGGVILTLEAPDHSGRTADVVLGCESPAKYADDTRYLGGVIGRYANRIAGARYELNGQEFELTANEGRNHLHGGKRGFDRAVWSVVPFEDDTGSGAELLYTSLAGEEGYPGTLEARVTYTLTDHNELIVDYRANCDQPTPVNLTQHMYFNLAGHDAGDILDHELTLNAACYLPVDGELIPTGEARSVVGTAFDFRSPQRIGDRIHADDEQLKLCDGYDHTFALFREPSHSLAFAARLRDPSSGRSLEIHTTEPGVQVYTGNKLADGPPGKGGHAYPRHGGIALETQHFPDSPNQPRFPSTILFPTQTYWSRTVYRFSA